MSATVFLHTVDNVIHIVENVILLWKTGRFRRKSAISSALPTKLFHLYPAQQ